MTPAASVTRSIDQVEAAMDSTKLSIDQQQLAISAHLYEIDKCNAQVATLERSLHNFGEQLQGLRMAYDRVSEQDADLFLHATQTFEGDRNVTG